MAEERKVASVLQQQLLVEATNRWFKADAHLWHIGQQLGKQLTEIVSEERERLHSSGKPDSALEAVKLVARDVWAKAFGQSIDSLKTNHRGTFHLKVNAFSWASNLPQSLLMDASLDDAAHPFLQLVTGLVHGALLLLGYDCSVNASVEHLNRSNSASLPHERSIAGPPIVISLYYAQASK